MAMSKKAKTFWLIAAIIGAGSFLYYWFRLRPLTDSQGNTFRLDYSKQTANGYQVLVNGQPNGILKTLFKAADGRIGGMHSDGNTYYFNGTSWGN